MSNSEPVSISKLRLQLAAATRMLEQRQIINYSGHISCRVPGSDDILIQSRNDSRATLEPERILRVGPDGQTVEGDGKPPSETIIHLEILKARPDVNSVLHCHMPSAVKFTLMQDTQLKPLLCHATRWRSGIPTHPTPAHIEFEEQGRALAQTLGPHNAALMRAHGMVLVSESVPGIFVDAIHFNENAEAYFDILRTGKEPAPLSEDEIDGLIAHERRGHHLRKIFGYYLDKSRDELPEEWDIDNWDDLDTGKGKPKS
jgi:ribulose-5-phosphate 4-epimerase/fuculose-1-phosphate aldolase